jgi:hypothetical protein
MEVDAEVGVTAPAEAIHIDEDGDMGADKASADEPTSRQEGGAASETVDAKRPAETSPPDVADTPPAAERSAAAEPATAADTSEAEPVAAADTAEAEPVAAADTSAAEPATAADTSAAEPATAADTTAAEPATAADTTAAEPATAADTSAAEPATAAVTAAASPVIPAEDPAPTLADVLPLAGGGAADAGAAGAGIAAAASATGSGSWIGTTVRGARRLSWKVTTAAAAAAVLVIVLGVVAATSSSSAVTSHKVSHKVKVEPVTVSSVSPDNGSTGVNGASPITVTYSGPIPKGTGLPSLSPNIAGSWQVSGDTATFTPQVGFTEDTHVTVTVPASPGTTTTTTAATSISFTTGHYSMLRLDQLLSQLGYIPVTWTPADPTGNIPATDPNAQLAAAYDPPSGTFSFDSGYPYALRSQWSVGSDNEVVDGAVRTFEFDHNLTMDGDAGPVVWSHLLAAVARGERNQHGYTYVLVDQAGTESLDLYHNGRLAITSPVNTGIAESPTDDGTFPVYLRYTVTQMIGTNPDGSPYDDTVYWVSYFNGGDAVHAFPRASYGWYQSLGCVELPTYGSTAEDVWNLITYGTLVTVTGPVA